MKQSRPSVLTALAAAAIALAWSLPVRASDDTPAPPAAQPPGPDKSITVGNSESSDSAVATPGQTPPETKARYSVNVFGYLRFLGRVVQDDPQVEFVGRNDGFRLQNARVGLEGRLANRLYVRLSIDGAEDERADTNDVEGTLRVGLADAFADVALVPSAQLRVGRFPILFDLEEFISASQRSFVDRSLESRGVAATEGFESPGLGVSRNMGVAMRAPRALELGGGSALGYEVAAQNGNGEFDANNDNDSLAYSGSMLGYLGRYVLVFASVRYNARTAGELPFRRSEKDLGTAFGTWIDTPYVRFAGQLIFRHTTFATTGEPDANAWGGHAELVGTIPGTGGLKLGYRFALLDDSDRIPQNRVIEHTAGVGYELPRYGLSFRLDLTIPVEESGRELDNIRGQALAQVQL